MENSNQVNTVEEYFKQSEIVVPFIDGNYIMKIAGENKFYIVDTNGNVVVRTKGTGENEFSEVNLSLRKGKMSSANFGRFEAGTMLVELSGDDNGEQVVDYMMITPSGRTKRLFNACSRNGLNTEKKFWVSSQINDSPRRFVNLLARDLESLDEMEFYFDIAQYSLIKQFEELESSRKAFVESGEPKTDRSESEYRKSLAKIETSARQIKKRYDELTVLIPRRIARQEAQAQAKQQKINVKDTDYDELREKTKNSLSAMFGPVND